MKIIAFDPGKVFEAELPIVVVSEANRSRCEHWGSVTKRKNAQKNDLKLLCEKFLRPMKEDDFALVCLTRISKKGLDDDNLGRAFKAIRDAIAKMLEIDDGAKNIIFMPAQKHGESGIQVRVEYFNNRLALAKAAINFFCYIHRFPIDSSSLRVE